MARDPKAHGVDSADAFDLVIPSIPGYGLSGPTRERGWNNYRIAAAWVELMRRLGYERYGAAGNDAGSLISPEVGQLDPDHVVRVHVTQIFSFPSGDRSEFEGLAPQEMTELGALQWFFENKMSFDAQDHPTKPTTVPLGLAGFRGRLQRHPPLRRARPQQHRELEHVSERRPLRGPHGPGRVGR